MSDPKKFICIHGHFYQPPRENAWLEAIEIQDSAAPFHDWNERINFECYAPNRAARILDHEGLIIKIVNNYTRISFNFGPTLLSWLASADPETYEAILEADKISMERFNGHGSAMAQVHSHIILPLANKRDKFTQVKWGIEDFKYRFGRMPEGIWLAETAVDTETLEILAEQGIKFTLLAPRQAKAFRTIGEENWHELQGTVDPRRPYLVNLPSGKTITLFFYDGGIAQGVAFDGLLNNGKRFAQRFIDSFDANDTPQLAHIATDGESYGHHHHNGEMALADCLNFIEESTNATLTNYGAYLAQFPPTHEVQIHDNSSWSCVHGVERWRTNCGCNSGGRPDWNQSWRTPLREVLNWIREELIPIYEQESKNLFKDPWAARDAYIQILLDRSKTNINSFFEQHALKSLSAAEITKALRLLEMQRHSMLMFTSCGWFFDEISGLETNQILQYANRAMSYAEQVNGIQLHDTFLARLEATHSNVYEDGSISYKEHVVPARVDLVRVGMHYAASSLFEAYPDRLEFFNYIATNEVFERFTAGHLILAIGKTTIKSKITFSEKHFSFAVLYLGQQNIIGNISTDMDRTTFDQMAKEIETAFKRTNLGDVIGLMQSYFGSEKYTIWHLFRDEKHKILNLITARQLKQVEAAFREIYHDNYLLMTSIIHSEIPVPSAFTNAVQFVVNRDLGTFFNTPEALDLKALQNLASELNKWNVNIVDESTFKLNAGERVFKEIQDYLSKKSATDHLDNLNAILEVLQEMGIQLDFWKSQNLYKSALKQLASNGHNGTSPGHDLLNKTFTKLGTLLKIRV